MPEQPDIPRDAATFILLSFARPQNLQRIINSVRQARCCGRIILSNNQPKTRIEDYVDVRSDLLDVIQQDQEWGPVKRYCIARECDGDFFICIDDDVFLTTEQIDRLFDELKRDPSRPHGVTGQNLSLENGVIKSTVGIQNVSCDVSILNQVYAFTKDHVRRYFELLQSLGLADPRDLGPLDDVVLSFSGARSPRIHDLGAVRLCPTWDKQGVALWRGKDFIERRIRIFFRLQSIAAGLAAPSPN